MRLPAAAARYGRYLPGAGKAPRGTVAVNGKLRVGFLVLVICQALHSVEEYVTRLWEVLPSARLVSSLFSDDLAFGFAAFNAAVAALGAWSCFIVWRSDGAGARGVASAWVVVELANAAGHIALAVAAGGYFPGALTAPLLAASAGFVAVQLRRRRLARIDAADERTRP